MSGNPVRAEGDADAAAGRRALEERLGEIRPRRGPVIGEHVLVWVALAPARDRAARRGARRGPRSRCWRSPCDLPAGAAARRRRARAAPSAGRAPDRRARARRCSRRRRCAARCRGLSRALAVACGGDGARLRRRRGRRLAAHGAVAPRAEPGLGVALLRDRQRARGDDRRRWCCSAPAPRSPAGLPATRATAGPPPRSPSARVPRRDRRRSRRGASAPTSARRSCSPSAARVAAAAVLGSAGGARAGPHRRRPMVALALLCRGRPAARRRRAPHPLGARGGRARRGRRGRSSAGCGSRRRASTRRSTRPSSSWRPRSIAVGDRLQARASRRWFDGPPARARGLRRARSRRSRSARSPTTPACCC